MKLLEIAAADTSLRDYQLKSKIEIYNAWESTPNVMFQMPTGTGKTRLFSSIINDILKCARENQEHSSVLVIAHRTELIEQISDTLGKKYRIAHGIIKSGTKEDMRFRVQVASIQSLSRRLDNWQKKSFSYIIIDEAHHAMAKTYRKICKSFSMAKVLGVTATPYRLSGESFRDLFGCLITSQSVNKFIEQGYLSQYKYYSIKPTSAMQKAIDSIDSFGTDGDYTESAMMKACDKDSIRASLVESYKEFALGRKGIIYTISHEHSKHVCDAYKALGLRIVCIDSNTLESERKQLVKEFRNGKIDIICNVNIFSEGFDCPDIEFIQLARPTLSLAIYLQQVGRGLRFCEGKKGAVIIDNVGLFNRFGLPSANRQWKRHFEGKNLSSTHRILKKKQQLEPTHNFEEGDDQLELVYSFGEDYIQSDYNKSNRQFILEALNSMKKFPIGIKGEIQSREQKELIEYIYKSDKTPEEKEIAIKMSVYSDSFESSIFGAYKYQNYDKWIEDVNDYITNSSIDDDEKEKFEELASEIYIFKYDGKYGVGRFRSSNIDKLKNLNKEDYSLDDFFEVYLEPVYDKIQLPNNSDQVLCIKDGKAGLINGWDKTEILPFKYDEICTITDKLFLVRKMNKWGLLKNDNILLKIEYDIIIPQSWLLPCSYFYMVEKNKVLGICDISKPCVNIQYKHKPKVKLTDSIYVGDADNNTCILLDKDGNILYPFMAQCISFTDEQKIIVEINSKEYYLISHENRTIEDLNVKDSDYYQLKKILTYKNTSKPHHLNPETPKALDVSKNTITAHKIKSKELRITDTSICLTNKGNGDAIYKREFKSVTKTPYQPYYICKSKTEYYFLVYASDYKVENINSIPATKIYNVGNGIYDLTIFQKNKYQIYRYDTLNPQLGLKLISK